MLPLIHQANYLLDQQLRRLEQDFLKQGGLSERMARVRLAYRTQPAKKRKQIFPNSSCYESRL